MKTQFFNTLKHFSFLLTMCISVSAMYAQETAMKRASEKYDNLEYIDAIDVYLRVANRGYESEELFQKLGNAYYFNANYIEAEKWYAKLFELNSTQENLNYYLRYSQSLRSNGKNELAEQFYDSFINKKSSTSVSNFMTSKDYLGIIALNSNRYELESASFNSQLSEYGGRMYDDKLLFSTNRRANSYTKNIDKWTNNYFFDIWYVKYNEDGSLNEPKRMKNGVNSKYHDASPLITSDKQFVYITRTNTTPKIDLEEKKRSNLKIYRAKINSDGVFSDYEDLSINGDTYSTANPSLSKDGKTLYYASNKPGGYGQTDIYKVAINKDGILGVPQNLGPAINTDGRESFPFITESNELYFASDGHLGLGGLDVFYVDLNQKILQMVNVGAPINSKADDFAFYLESNGKGLLSSNRSGGSGKDDIYMISETKSIKEYVRAKVSGVVVDKDTKKPLAGVTILIKDKKGNILQEVISKEDGSYDLLLNKFYDNYIVADKEDYARDDVFVQADPKLDSKTIDFNLKTTKILTNDDENIALPLNIQSIYFEFNKSEILKKSEVELMKVVEFMRLKKHIKISIGSHTDSRGNDSYNMRLSKQRAEATKAFIVSKGIDAGRLISKGYGESQIINKCKNGVKCNEKEHQRNRRSDFNILKI